MNRPWESIQIGGLQIRYWGIVPSMGYVREQETNGVVERFNRTFKEPSHFKRSGVLNYLRKGIRPRRQLRFSTYHLEPLSRTLKASNISLTVLLRLNSLRSKLMSSCYDLREAGPPEDLPFSTSLLFLAAENEVGFVL